MNHSVTVITLTRKRPELLKRAIVSVQQQDYLGKIKHLLVIDECLNTKQYLLDTATDLPHNLSWQWLPRNSSDRLGPARVAKLRNYAVRIANTKWVSFLDDDNEFEPNHISSLISCAKRTRYPAVHSFLQIFWRDGSPYLEPRLPWCRDPKEGERLYIEMYNKGVFQLGSNIIRDRFDPWDHPNPIRTVDMGEWLLDRTLLLKHPLCIDYDFGDWKNVTTEDDKLLEVLVENRVPVACSGLPTLKYYLGGYSNTFGSENVWNVLES